LQRVVAPFLEQQQHVRVFEVGVVAVVDVALLQGGGGDDRYDRRAFLCGIEPRPEMTIMTLLGRWKSGPRSTEPPCESGHPV
jgi:hypothetical protein